MDLLRDLYARFRVLIHEVAKFGIVGILAFFITIGGANGCATELDSARSPR